MKQLILLLALLNGGYMLADGIHVLAKGKYIGPERPGPWAALFSRMDVNVFKLGPLFVAFGILWLTFAIGLWTQQAWSCWFGVAVSVLTLWYVPFGTLFSLMTLIVLLSSKQTLEI
jgi:hypothetical protein